jgi:hypothetical protein
MHQAFPLAFTAGYNPSVLFRSVTRPSEKKYGWQRRQQPLNAWQHPWQFSRYPRENARVPGGFWQSSGEEGSNGSSTLLVREAAKGQLRQVAYPPEQPSERALGSETCRKAYAGNTAEAA